MLECVFRESGGGGGGGFHLFCSMDSIFSWNSIFSALWIVFSDLVMILKNLQKELYGFTSFPFASPNYIERIVPVINKTLKTQI